MDTEYLNDSNLQDGICRSNCKKVTKFINKKKPQFEIHCMGNNVNLISEDFAKSFISNNSTSSNSSNEIKIDFTNFPLLGQLKNTKRPKQEQVLCNSDVLHENQFSLQAFIKSKPNVSVEWKKQNPLINVKYSGNPLDSDLPLRKSGKFREVPKSKKHSKLKQKIMVEKEESCAEEKYAVEVKDVFCENILSNDELVCSFLSRVVELQEKLYKRDPIKGKSKRRFVVGLHEAKKYLTLNKVKIVIIATDIKIDKVNGAIQTVIEQVINLCKQNNVFYFFALKRRKLGTITLKSIPISCITIMNYEGAEEQFNKLKTLLIPTHLTESPPEVDQTKILELLRNN